jgi:hypothetical protein
VRRGKGQGARGKGQGARGKGQGARGKGQGARGKGQGARGKGGAIHRAAARPRFTIVWTNRCAWVDDGSVE